MSKRPKHRAAVSIAGPGYDGNPPEKGFRRDYTFAGTRRIAVESPVNLNLDRIRWLYAHNKIEDRQFYAADKLEKDWHTAEIQPVASSVMVGAGGRSDMHPNDAKLAAGDRYRAAVKALGRWWPVVDLVVMKHMTTQKAGSILKISSDRAMERLSGALHILADHYGFPGAPNAQGIHPFQRCA